jgi:hypothetical protein
LSRSRIAEHFAAWEGHVAMRCVDPEIMETAIGLSLGLCTAALVLGLLLWIFGWRAHRFWIVLTVTVAAGLVGLDSGNAWGAQPIICGLLLALAAGFMALALVRILAFSAGGLAAWLAIHGLAPQFHEPLLCFLSGGLFGLFLFRLWTMVLTSSAATLLMAYSGLCLAAKLANLDAIGLAQRQGIWLNFACGSIMLAGVLVQYLLERSRGKGKRGKPTKRKPQPPKDDDSESAWGWLGEHVLRRAG